MKQTLNLASLEQFPEWHHQPMRLSTTEMDKPTVVLDDFFDAYSLPGLRTKLNHWLRDSLTNNEANAADMLLLRDEIEKLIEAAWLIHQRQAIDA